MFKAISAFSDDFDSEDAIQEILKECDQQLGGLTPVAGLLFSGTEFEHQTVLNHIMRRFPGLQLIGCTTDGEMSSSGGYTEDAITLTLICSDTIEIYAGYGTNAGEQPASAVTQAVDMCRKDACGKPSLAIILPDGLTSSAYRVLQQLGDKLGTHLPVVGGMSADRVAMGKDRYASYQFYGNKVLTDSLPMLLFSGPLAYSLGVESGWTPIGKRMTVTQSEGHILKTLDDKPAFDLYVHYLGDVLKENLAGIGSYPLAVYEEGLDRFYLRVPKSAHTDNGYVDFLGEVPEGAQVQITQAIRDEIINGVDRSVESALNQYPQDSKPGMAMMFSCTGRKIALGTRTRDEVRRAKAGLGKDIPMTGFYSFGEIGPVADHAHARYHNTTFVTLLIGEAGV